MHFQLNRQNKTRRGSALGPVLIFTSGFALVGMGILSMSITNGSINQRASSKWQSENLAVSGVNVLYDQIREEMLNDLTFSFDLASQAHLVPNGGSNIKIGDMEAHVIDNREVQTDTSWGGSNYRKYEYFFTIEGIGTADGIESRVQMKFKGEAYRALVPRDSMTGADAPGTFSFPIGGMTSNGAINFDTLGGISVTSDSGNAGHILANGGIGFNNGAVSKTAITSPSFLDIQGYWLVPDGAPYSSTLSNSGLGNANGTTNYQSPAAPAAGTFPGAPANSVIRLDGSASFADSTTVTGWQSQWLTSAQATGGTSYTNLLSTSIAPDASGKKVLACPSEIAGSLTVAAGETLHLYPVSSNPKKNVIYVHGDISNLGNIVNHGVTIVTDSSYMDTPTSSYKVEQDPKYFKTLPVAMMRSALISNNNEPDAIKITSNQSTSIGLVYSTLGGIEVTGSNLTLDGMLCAGGVGSDGGINIAPADKSKFTLHYNEYASTGGPLSLDASSVIDTDWVPSTIVSAFNPSKLSDYRQIK